MNETTSGASRTHTHTQCDITRKSNNNNNEWRERESSNSIVLLVTHLLLHVESPLLLPFCFVFFSSAVVFISSRVGNSIYWTHSQCYCTISTSRFHIMRAKQRPIWCQRSLTERMITIQRAHTHTQRWDTTRSPNTVFMDYRFWASIKILTKGQWLASPRRWLESVRAVNYFNWQFGTPQIESSFAKFRAHTEWDIERAKRPTAIHLSELDFTRENNVSFACQFCVVSMMSLYNDGLFFRVELPLLPLPKLSLHSISSDGRFNLDTIVNEH